MLTIRLHHQVQLMSVAQKSRQDIEIALAPLSENASLALSIAQSCGDVVPNEAIALVRRIESGELTTDQAIELVIKAHQ
jgi:hypothetical protein